MRSRSRMKKTFCFYIGTCTSFHGFLINLKEQLFGFGANEEGQLGMGFEKTFHTALIRNPFFEKNSLKIKKISTGRRHSVFLTEKGHCFSCGNSPSGETGLNERKIGTPTMIETTLSELKIVDVECGEDNSFFIDSRGNVYNCGRDRNGSLGHGNNGHRHFKRYPKRIDFFHSKGISIKSVHPSWCFAMYLSAKGRVFGTGSNSYGQLTASVQENHCVVPQEITYFQENGLKVSSIDVGYISTYFLVENDRSHQRDSLYDFYGVGSNHHHRIGINFMPEVPAGTNSENKVPKRILSNVMSLSAGGGHCAMIVKSKVDGKKRVKGCGYAIDGQLGEESENEKEEGCIRTFRLEALKQKHEKIVHVQCSASTTYFITDEGKIYGTGNNEKGSLFLDEMYAGDLIKNPKILVNKSKTTLIYDGGLKVKGGGACYGRAFEERFSFLISHLGKKLLVLITFVNFKK